MKLLCIQLHTTMSFQIFKNAVASRVQLHYSKIYGPNSTTCPINHVEIR